MGFKVLLLSPKTIIVDNYQKYYTLSLYSDVGGDVTIQSTPAGLIHPSTVSISADTRTDFDITIAHQAQNYVITASKATENSAINFNVEKKYTNLLNADQIKTDLIAVMESIIPETFPNEVFKLDKHIGDSDKNDYHRHQNRSFQVIFFRASGGVMPHSLSYFFLVKIRYKKNFIPSDFDQIVEMFDNYRWRQGIIHVENRSMVSYPDESDIITEFECFVEAFKYS